MNAASAFRQVLSEGDVQGLRELWALTHPHLPPLQNAAQAEIVLHRARTETRTVPFKKRAYSHAWLVERGLPSGLPDYLKPRAERLYPVISEAVGISVTARRNSSPDRAIAVQQAMEGAVLECYADGVQDVTVIKARMQEARQKVG